MNSLKNAELDRERISSAMTSIFHSWEFYAPEETGRAAAEVLGEKLPHISKSSWPDRFALGGVFINGLRASVSDVLPCPAKLEYYEPKFEISQAANFFPPFDQNRIVFEDEFLLVYAKPPGLPSMPTKEQARFSVKSQIANYLGFEPHLPSRIDTSASGLVFISKSERANAPLQRLYSGRQIRKSYILETTGIPPWISSTTYAEIGRDRRHPVLRTTVPSGGQAAQTDFRVLGPTPNGALVLAQPRTGRTHQIRVHAAHLGFPIVGDSFYRGSAAAELHLLSFAFSCGHPVTRKPLAVRMPEALLPEWVDRAVVASLALS